MEKLIDLHKKWCESGYLDDLGLCNELKELGDRSYSKLLYSLFNPDFEERAELEQKGMATCYWGSGLKNYKGPRNHLYRKEESGYTPLRQTIVLLICAMKGEI